MTKDDLILMMADAGLKAPARGDFIFIHWDQISLLLDFQREMIADICSAKVKRDAGYGGRFGGYGNFIGDKTGAECSEIIRSINDYSDYLQHQKAQQINDGANTAGEENE